MEAFGGQKDMGTYVIEVTELISEVRFDLEVISNLQVASAIKRRILKIQK